MSEFKLTQEIIALSEADNWDQAKLEWGLDDIYKVKEPQRCLCNHYPIIEICEILNIKNGTIVEVGNCCVKKFTGLPSDKIFQAVNRVLKDVKRSLNAETIQHAFDRGRITDWEYGFYFDIMRKRKLSEKQLNKKIQINRMILKHIIGGKGN